MRARKERSDQGKMRWTKRTESVLRVIGDQYAMRIDHLEVLLGREASEVKAVIGGTRAVKTPGRVSWFTARKLIARWEEAGIVEFGNLLGGQPGWAWLTAKGLARVGRDYRRCEPNVTMRAHLHAVNRVRLWIEQRYPKATWRSERELWSEQEIMRGGERQEHRPDAELVQDEHTIAIEVELTPKHSVRFRAILYELATKYQGIWYFTRPEMLPHMERALADLDAKTLRQFAVVALAEETVAQVATQPAAPNPVVSPTDRG